MRRPLGSVALLLGIACSLVFAGGASAAFPPAAGAARYAVHVTGSDGEKEFFMTAAGKRRVKVRGVNKDDSATVSVEGVRADGVTGRAAQLRVRPVKKRR